MKHLEFLSALAQPNDSKLILLVLDGVGDIRTREQPRTALELASTPLLDELAARSALGRVVPVVQGVTPGSGPGHLALFGYDPTDPTTDIGRGVLEALGMGLELGSDDVAVRGNFATADADGNLTDRRAGRPSNEECRRLCGLLNEALSGFDAPTARVEPGEGHRFVLLLEGGSPDSAIADTDPQRLGVPPLRPRAERASAEPTVELLERIIGRMQEALAGEAQANRVLLRGFSRLPALPSMADAYRMRLGAFAGYPLYRGVASACGMEVVPCGKKPAETFAAVGEHWSEYDFFFIHIKQPDMAGEDGDVEAKARVLEEIDQQMARLLDLGPSVLAITGDHSTPAPLQAHSWHPVPLLLYSDRCFPDDCDAFDELQARRGLLGDLRSEELVGLMLANAGRLAKFGA